MNFVIISPHFPPNYHHFWTALKAKGVNTLGIGEDPYETLSQEVQSSLTEYYQVDNMMDYEQMLRACGHFTFRYGKIDRIESHNEFWLEIDAKLRTDFNVPGLKVHEMFPLKYKSGMKPVFQEIGIPTAPGMLVKDTANVKAFIRDHGYPVIAKPDNGVGAYATYKLHNDDELNLFLKNKLPVDYFIESFVEGVIHSFDGMTNSAGQIVLSSGLVYGINVMESVNEDLDMFIYIPRELSPKIVDAGEKAIEAFNLRERFFHLEFFVTKNDEIVALELNARPPGGMIVDMINFANDINVYELYAQMITEGSVNTEIHRPYNCFYLGRKHKFNYVLTPEELAAQYPGQVVFHGPISDAFAAAMGNYAVIYRTITEKEGLLIQQKAMEKR